MLFDVKAALAEILNAVPVTAMSVTAIPANAAIVGDRTGAESQQSRQSQLGQSQPEKAQPCISVPDAQSSGAVVIHLARGKTGLPTHSATCAVCGVSDWKVCMRDARGRTMHVGCWRGGEREE